MVRPSVRTDKWQIVATRQQKELLQNTVSEFRRLVRCLVGVVNTHWSTIGLLDAKSQISSST
jgi:putative transposase